MSPPRMENLWRGDRRVRRPALLGPLKGARTGLSAVNDGGWEGRLAS